MISKRRVSSSSSHLLKHSAGRFSSIFEDGILLFSDLKGRGIEPLTNKPCRSFQELQGNHVSMKQLFTVHKLPYDCFGASGGGSCSVWPIGRVWSEGLSHRFLPAGRPVLLSKVLILELFLSLSVFIFSSCFIVVTFNISDMTCSFPPGCTAYSGLQPHWAGLITALYGRACLFFYFIIVSLRVSICPPACRRYIYTPLDSRLASKLTVWLPAATCPLTSSATCRPAIS